MTPLLILILCVIITVCVTVSPSFEWHISLSNIGVADDFVLAIGNLPKQEDKVIKRVLNLLSTVLLGIL